MIFILVLLVNIMFLLYILKKYEVILNVLQINSYENAKTIEIIKDRSNTKSFIKEFVLIVPILLSCTTNHLLFCLSELIVLIIFVVFYVKENKKFNESKKKPLVNTDRIKRIKLVNLILTIILMVVSLIGFAYIGIPKIFSFSIFAINFAEINFNLITLVVALLQYGIYILCSKLAVYIVVLSNVLLVPVEKKINQRFYDEAKDKLKSMKDLKIIGITGSYGKTSTKYILDGILSLKYNVCKTPGSYNTLLGVVRTTREELKPTDQIFIVEMGARHKNDIKEICDLVNPEYGIITAIGNQHFETFKSIENIKQTKYELVRSLEGDKIAVLNIDNEHIRDIVSREKLNEMQHTTICYSLKNKDADYYASSIEYTKNGVMFDVTAATGETVKINTKLLGVHNIYNTLGAIALANKLGMKLEDIAKACTRLQPVEHRLQIIKSNPNITVIDDTFNANPEGTAEALEVLRRIEGKKKIIITPGMIELGEKQYTLNLEFGEKCAKICDYTIMVGVIQTKAMQDAFKNMGIDKSKYYVAKDLNDATSRLQGILGFGDVVLYENDLPEDF